MRATRQSTSHEDALKAARFGGVQRHLYLGAVALLVRMHSRMGRKERENFDADGDPLARLPADFNRLDFTRKMVRNGYSWMLDSREDE